MKTKTINKSRELVYVAQGFVTGLSDLIIVVRKPDGTLFTPAPTFTEQGDGVYTLSYTPDLLGTWQEKISSVTNGDVLINAYDVVAYDVDDIQGQVDGVETKVDTIQTGVTSANNKLDSIETKVDSLDLQIKSGGYIA